MITLGGDHLVGKLYEQGIEFKSLTDSTDTATPSGRFFFHVMASLAEMERELTVERTRVGLEIDLYIAGFQLPQFLNVLTKPKPIPPLAPIIKAFISCVL